MWQGSSNQDQNLLNFWAYQIWCHSIETNADRVIIGRKWWNRSWFSIYFFFSLISYGWSIPKPTTQKNSRFLRNFHFSKSYIMWKRKMQIDQWSNSHGCLIDLSRDMVLQSLSSNFPSPGGSSNNPQKFLIPWHFQIWCHLTEMNVN